MINWNLKTRSVIISSSKWNEEKRIRKCDLEGRERVSEMIDWLSERKFSGADFEPERVMGSERPKPVADTGNCGNVFGF